MTEKEIIALLAELNANKDYVKESLDELKELYTRRVEEACAKMDARVRELENFYHRVRGIVFLVGAISGSISAVVTIIVSIIFHIIKS